MAATIRKKTQRNDDGWMETSKSGDISNGLGGKYRDYWRSTTMATKILTE